MKQTIAQKQVKQMGLYAFVRMCKNLGMDAEDVIASLYGTPTVCKKPHLFVPYLEGI
jgi:hypothetical protein